MRKSLSNLILEQLAGIKNDLVVINTKVDKGNSKLLEHDLRFDRIFGKLVEHDLRFHGVEDKIDGMATKEDVRMLQTGIDALAVQSQNLDQEFTVLKNK